MDYNLKYLGSFGKWEHVVHPEKGHCMALPIKDGKAVYVPMDDFDAIEHKIMRRQVKYYDCEQTIAERHKEYQSYRDHYIEEVMIEVARIMREIPKPMQRGFTEKLMERLDGLANRKHD